MEQPKPLHRGRQPHRNSKGTAFRLFLYIRVFSCVMNTRHGPSGETQTRGLAVPNRAFYQLNYTRILNFEVFLSVVIPVVKAVFRSGQAVRSNPANARAARLPGLCVLVAWIGGAALPNHPRYQLRHTRILLSLRFRRESWH